MQQWQFQFSPPRGGDWPSSGISSIRSVSILAPARGGDKAQTGYIPKIHVSILAPARGATAANYEGSLYKVFQFSPPRGGRRLEGGARYDMRRCFNSRPREGGDRIPLTVSPLSRFQFSPPRGGATIRCVLLCARASFQFSPPRGGRRFFRTRVLATEPVSILAPARGATFIGIASEVIKKFQFSPPRGGRLSIGPSVWT